MPDLDLRSLLRRLDLLFYRLESGSEYGSGQLGYVWRQSLTAASTPSLISFCRSKE